MTPSDLFEVSIKFVNIIENRSITIEINTIEASTSVRVKPASFLKYFPFTFFIFSHLKYFEHYVLLLRILHRLLFVQNVALCIFNGKFASTLEIKINFP